MDNLSVAKHLEDFYSAFPDFQTFRVHLSSVLTTRIQRLVDDKTNLEKRHAGVLLSLTYSNELLEESENYLDKIFILLEKRSYKLKKNPGDVSFPGGSQDPEDKNIIETAYREAFEELGINSSQLEYISNLDEFVSSSGLIVHPIVAWLVEKPKNNLYDYLKQKYDPKTEETDETIVIPLSHLLDPQFYSSREYKIENPRTKSKRGYIRYFNIDDYSKGTKIWGLTASVLRRFADIVFPMNLLVDEPTT